MADVTLHFVHPTDSTQVLTATVGDTSTPNYLVKQLIQSGFIANAGEGAAYRLVNAQTGKELVDHAALGAAGVVSGATLNVLHSVTGAARGPR